MKKLDNPSSSSVLPLIHQQYIGLGAEYREINRISYNCLVVTKTELLAITHLHYLSLQDNRYSLVGHNTLLNSEFVARTTLHFLCQHCWVLLSILFYCILFCKSCKANPCYWINLWWLLLLLQFELFKINCVIFIVWITL